MFIILESDLQVFKTASNNICLLSHSTAIRSECFFSRWYPSCLSTKHSNLPQTVYLLIVADIFPLRSNERYCLKTMCISVLKLLCSSYMIMQPLMKVCVCVCVARVCGLWIDWVHLHILSSCPLNRMAGRALEWASEGTLESPLRPHLRICYTNMLIGMLIQLVITRTWVYCSMSAFEVGKLGNCLHIKCATELV